MTKPSQELLCLQFFPHLLHIAGGRTGVAADAADVDAVDAVDAVDPAEAFIQTHELRPRRHVGHGHGRVPRVGHWHWASGSGGATWENCLGIRRLGHSGRSIPEVGKNTTWFTPVTQQRYYIYGISTVRFMENGWIWVKSSPLPTPLLPPKKRTPRFSPKALAKNKVGPAARPCADATPQCKLRSYHTWKSLFIGTLW